MGATQSNLLNTAQVQGQERKCFQDHFLKSMKNMKKKNMTCDMIHNIVIIMVVLSDGPLKLKKVLKDIQILALHCPPGWLVVEYQS